jgi:hypothetical protein
VIQWLIVYNKPVLVLEHMHIALFSLVFLCSIIIKIFLIFSYDYLFNTAMEVLVVVVVVVVVAVLDTTHHPSPKDSNKLIYYILYSLLYYY